jgi:hypothetical protein
LVGAVLPSFNVPKSQYDGYKHKLPIEKEFQVVLQLLVSYRYLGLIDA